jgi:hypothetical protein
MSFTPNPSTSSSVFTGINAILNIREKHMKILMTKFAVDIRNNNTHIAGIKCRMDNALDIRRLNVAIVCISHINDN